MRLDLRHEVHCDTHKDEDTRTAEIERHVELRNEEHGKH